MKKFRFRFIFPILIVLFLASCLHTLARYNLTYYTPVYISLEELRQSFDVKGPAVLHNPGKLVIYSDLIFINEKNKGIHIIDNTDPGLPEVLGFINIPGNYDIAVKDGYLYADSYIDILVIDIKNLSNITLLKKAGNCYSL